MPPEVRPHIVIIGAGFAGLSALLELQHARIDAKITLVDEHPYFEYVPALHLCLTDPYMERRVRFSLRNYYHDVFLQARVERITEKQVVTDKGPLPYDYLVIATGSVSNTFGNESLAKNAYPAKTFEDVERLRPALEKAKRVAIIGGGYTGVELASVLAEDTTKRIDIIDADPHVLHGVNNKAQQVAKKHLQKDHVHFHLGKLCKECTDTCVVLADGSRIDADVRILCAGIRPHNDFVPEKLREADDTLRSKADKRVYFCGDVAKGFALATGHNAMLEGRLVGKNIARSIKKLPLLHFHAPKTTLLGVALGHHWGVVPIGNRNISSHLVGLLKWLVEVRCMFEFRHRVLLPL